MRWRKMGLLFQPKGQFDWVVSHAYVPFALQLAEQRFRVYFAGRNKENKAQAGYLEVSIDTPGGDLYISHEPVLRLGKPGLFDDAAVGPAWIVKRGSQLLMYYWGWMRGLSAPYYSAIGLATSEDGGRTFAKYSEAPILDRNEVDPYSTTLCCVMAEGDLWRMWYTSMVDFRVRDNKPMYYYHIKYCESKDGVRWARRGLVSIDFKDRHETRITRPCVIREGDRYKMWYCCAVDRYRLGYAESIDGVSWVRKDEEVGVDASETGWDSEMICYPFVFEHGGRKYMLYNGNRYGETGLGYAILEEG